MKIRDTIDQNFKPAFIEIQDFNKKVSSYKEKKHLVIAIERDNGNVFRYEFDILPEGVNDELNVHISERLIKTILWVAGGFRIYISGSHYIYQKIKDQYSLNGKRAFDFNFFKTCYERDMEVIELPLEEMPKYKNTNVKLGGHLEGKRIGFDAGGSDRKCSAVVNGETVYSEEVVWQPKLTSDISYHYDGIYQAFKTAVDKMGGDCDGIGVSTAGVIIDSRPMVSSLFIKVPKSDFEKVKMVYIANVKRLEKELGHPIPYVIANDGDVTALAGAIDLKSDSVLGIAMGTSEAVGYINQEGSFNGWISELAFAPVDFNGGAMKDEWSGDIGVGCKYFSQDAAIKLADMIKLNIDHSLPLGEQLKQIQALANADDPKAIRIFENIGVYLAYTIPYYCMFYNIKHLMLLGRVMSGKGGDIILKVAKETLKEEFPSYSSINICTPSEYMRRVGQSIAAASLPYIK